MKKGVMPILFVNFVMRFVSDAKQISIKRLEQGGITVLIINDINVSEEKNKGAKNVTPTVRNFSLDFNNYNNDIYINIFVYDNKKNKDATNVASMVKHILADYKNYSNNNYINISINNDNAENAPVALMVMHQPHKLGLSRHLGFPRDDLYEASNSCLGASAFNFSKIAQEGDVHRFPLG